MKAQSRFTVRGEHSEDLGGLLDRQAAEEAHLDEPRQARLLCRQAIERAVEVEELGGAQRGFHSAVPSLRRPKCIASAPRLAARRPRAWSTRMRRMIREEKAKKCVRSCHRMRLQALELEEGFVDERGGLQGVAGPFALQLLRGDGAELVVDAE